MQFSSCALFASLLASTSFAGVVPRQANLDSCPGYEASNVQHSETGLTADLTLSGTGCNVYGHDLQDLSLIVEYQSSM